MKSQFKVPVWVIWLAVIIGLWIIPPTRLIIRTLFEMLLGILGWTVFLVAILIVIVLIIRKFNK